MIPTIKEALYQSEPFLRFNDLLGREGTPRQFAITGVSGSLMGFVADVMAQRYPCVFIVVPDKDKAEKLRDDCNEISRDRRVNLYAHTEHHKSTTMDISGPIAQIESLLSLMRKENTIIVASAEALCSPVPPPQVLLDRSLKLTKDEEYPFEDLLKKLDSWGFEKKDFVEGYGDVAVRGGILDIFPYVGDHAIRIEFWGDTIESIREFDSLSQRSIRDLESAQIVAGFPERGGNRSTIVDHLPKDAVFLIEEPELCNREVEELLREGISEFSAWPAMIETLKGFPLVTHSMFFSGTNVDAQFGSSPQPPFQGSIKLLVDHLQQETTRDYSQIVVCDSPEEQLRIRELLAEERERADPDTLKGWDIPRIVVEAIHAGFVYPPANFLLYTEHEIFGRLKRRTGRKLPRFRGFSQREVYRLKKGDFVVHADYGVGKFGGLQTIRVRGNEQEVMKIQYQEDDVLYVNLNFVNRVQKYSSQEGHEPHLTKLGTSQWDKIKARVRKRIKDIARELIKLYAARKHNPGFAFSADSHWQKEMEASFLYEDTPDQAKATEAVKADMGEPVPMDRLICGDVGFGKTEVAVRAAFKAALDGKQTAVLVPTTILAEQHYQTFLGRLERYSVRVSSLTRFKSKKEQLTILKNLVEGQLDVVIGTHRLLSKDVQFKNLGLLVIDEEHRFGVTSKEKLRQMSASVDTLTLTATPIPRTLQFSLMGARDLSIINTPPRNRLPIVTEIVEFDLGIIREAILRELHRGGQVYVIHDRIHTMDDIVTLLQSKVPEARFHSAHGQMKGHELEKAMMGFLERKYDVLVCTKIIESGIDIPRVNTILINRADRFGLAELYQLRGRVGRSNVQAYAYLLTPPLISLPRVALQRLQSIQEFTELGSGFNLALRDMEIRGAGNLLGAEQSGFIMEMGFEMYQRVVEEAVHELKDEEFKSDFEKSAVEALQPVETVIESDIETLIPDFYVESDQERLDIYRRLYAARTAVEVNSIREELTDRFGEAPSETEQLLRQVGVKVLAAQLGIHRIELSGPHLLLFLPLARDERFYGKGEDAAAPFQAIMGFLSGNKEPQFQLLQEKEQLKLRISLTGEKEAIERLNRSLEILSKFLEAIHAKEVESHE